MVHDPEGPPLADAVADVVDPMAGATTPAPPRAAPLPRPATFRDPELERSFRNRGFVVVRLLDDERRQQLLADYAALTHDHDRSLPFAEGFHTTLYDDRYDYRVDVTAAIEGALAPGLDRVLTGHRIQFANFQVKVPGAATLPEHIDWTFVDEERATSVTVWCATHAIDRTNGSLGVYPGSHDVVRFTRAVNHRFYDRHSEAAGGSGDPDVLSLQAGEAVIFDNRLLHFSVPNCSDGPRLAASCIATPADEPVFHFWFDEDDAVHRLEVQPEFWLDYAIGQDPRTVAGVVADDLVEGGRFA